MMNDASYKRAQRVQDFRTTWWPLICYAGTIVFVFLGPWELLMNYLVAGAIWGATFPIRQWIRDDCNGPIFDGPFDFVMKLAMGAVEVFVWPLAVPFGTLVFRNLKG